MLVLRRSMVAFGQDWPVASQPDLHRLEYLHDDGDRPTPDPKAIPATPRIGPAAARFFGAQSSPKPINGVCDVAHQTPGKTKARDGHRSSSIFGFGGILARFCRCGGDAGTPAGRLVFCAGVLRACMDTKQSACKLRTEPRVVPGSQFRRLLWRTLPFAFSGRFLVFSAPFLGSLDPSSRGFELSSPVDVEIDRLFDLFWENFAHQSTECRRILLSHFNKPVSTRKTSRKADFGATAQYQSRTAIVGETGVFAAQGV
jgi:hypothetical protein